MLGWREFWRESREVVCGNGPVAARDAGAGGLVLGAQPLRRPREKCSRARAGSGDCMSGASGGGGRFAVDRRGRHAGRHGGAVSCRGRRYHRFRCRFPDRGLRADEDRSRSRPRRAGHHLQLRRLAGAGHPAFGRGGGGRFRLGQQRPDANRLGERLHQRRTDHVRPQPAGHRHAQGQPRRPGITGRSRQRRASPGPGAG